MLEKLSIPRTLLVNQWELISQLKKALECLPQKDLQQLFFQKKKGGQQQNCLATCIARSSKKLCSSKQEHVKEISTVFLNNMTKCEHMAPIQPLHQSLYHPPHHHSSHHHPLHHHPLHHHPLHHHPLHHQIFEHQEAPKSLMSAEMPRSLQLTASPKNQEKWLAYVYRKELDCQQSDIMGPFSSEEEASLGAKRYIENFYPDSLFTTKKYVEIPE